MSGEQQALQGAAAIAANGRVDRNVMRLAALFVQPSGCYADLLGIDAWPERRDARRYTGPLPVVAHVCWWKPESKGYTICIDKAGRYSEEEARSICRTGLCIAVPVVIAAELVRSTPYYRRTDGSLAKLYDGDQHRPVPNDLQAWKHLLSGRLGGCAHPEKPTPIGAKARAIYLPPNA